MDGQHADAVELLIEGESLRASAADKHYLGECHRRARRQVDNVRIEGKASLLGRQGLITPGLAESLDPLAGQVAGLEAWAYHYVRVSRAGGENRRDCRRRYCRCRWG